MSIWIRSRIARFSKIVLSARFWINQGTQDWKLEKDEILFEPLIDETFNQLKFATATGTGGGKGC
ncbi:MAG: hypothetical protein U5K54_07685 [Cytophagales bacterium]|nr:hypothetical protein [Cytophagales bacterium]